MIENEQEEEEVEIDQLDNNKTELDNDESRDEKNKAVTTINNNEYELQRIFGKYINNGYTCDRTTTTDVMSINTNNTAATNDET